LNSCDIKNLAFLNYSFFRPSEVPKNPQNPDRFIINPATSSSPRPHKPFYLSHLILSLSLSSSNPPPQHQPLRSRHHQRQCPWPACHQQQRCRRWHQQRRLAVRYRQQRPAVLAVRYRQRHPSVRYPRQRPAERFQQHFQRWHPRFQQPDQRHRHRLEEKRWD
jgi:hypothetical protein